MNVIIVQSGATYFDTQNPLIVHVITPKNPLKLHGNFYVAERQLSLTCELKK